MPIFSPADIARYTAAINNQPPAQVQQAQEQPKGLPWGYKAGLIGSQLFDAGTTQAVLNGNKGHEANSAVAPIANNPALLYGVKGGLGALGAFGLDKLSQAGHPKLAKGLSLGLTGAGVIPGIHNLHELSKR